MQAGDAYNVIPETAVMRGTIRAFRKDVMATIKEKVERRDSRLRVKPNALRIRRGEIVRSGPS
jgi:acetylornithine deacetylase/succinyl-diaminopimelate desuccinylase-like protein